MAADEWTQDGARTGMTTPELVHVLLRRWYLMMVGAAISLVVLYQVTHVSPTYFTQYSVVLLPPSSRTFPNTIEDPHYGLTPLAGLVVADYNAGAREPLMGSAETTLYGEGLRRGSRVRLPNDGSQWQPMYDKPNIDVQVVDPNPEVVRVRATEISTDLIRILKQRQDAAGVRSTMRVTALVSSQDPIVVPVGGSRSRAALAVTVSGATITSILVVLLDRYLMRRPRRGLRVGPNVIASSDQDPILAD